LRTVGVILCRFFSGSDSLVATGRDKDATWQSLGTLCRARDWSKPRALYELQNGLPHRTVPPLGHAIDWHDREVQRSLDVTTSEVMIAHALEVVKGEGGIAFIWPGTERLTVWIEVLVPTDASPAPVPSLPPIAASPSPPASPRKNVSEPDLRDCLLTIVKEHPPGSPPPSEETLHAELERRFGTPLPRPRVRNALEEHAPQFKLPVGRPRKGAQ
jgi:hypothetical protein